MIRHFTDFGQIDHNFDGFPARCFVRHQKNSEWKSFWERKRNSSELNEERKNDDGAEESNHAEIYAIGRLERLFNINNKKSQRPNTVEMFVNASPCPSCFETSKGFAGKYNVTFNVKYSSFHHKSNKEDFR